MKVNNVLIYGINLPFDSLNSPLREINLPQHGIILPC
jgi:hypothetical protein